MNSKIFAPLLLAAGVSAAACSATPSDGPTTDESSIVDVDQTPVERQLLGNCWIYAEASWMESMHRTATGEELDVSQSYWTYWHWFEQIANSGAGVITQGGTWETANNLIRRYGILAEKDFIAGDQDAESSARQKEALAAINASLATGALSDPAVRRDRAKVRAELDLAWGLAPEQTELLDRVFGTTVSRTFTSSSPADNAGTPVVRGSDFLVSYSLGPGREVVKRPLTQAMRDWRLVYYPPSSSRYFLQRVQRALHDRQPVIISWFVDFNAFERRPEAADQLRGSFNMTTLAERGPGSQASHMTVLEDYQATLADGTVLAAGTTLDRDDPAQRSLLDRALESSTTIDFLRTKNSWGTQNPVQWAADMPGYTDLHLDYLKGPIARCATKEDGTTDTERCEDEAIPLQRVVLPPGY